MFFLIPFHVDVPMERIPFTNWILMAATVFVSLFLMGNQYVKEVEGKEDVARHIQVVMHMKHTSAAEQTEDEKKQLSEVLDFFFQPGTLRRDRFSLWQLFTCVFVHAGMLHLISNMVFLFVFGNAVNAKLGHLPFVALYFVSGAVAAAAWLLFDRAGYGLVGASGAIAGIVGAFLVLYPRNDISVFYFFWLIRFVRFGMWRLSSYWIIILFMLQDLVGTLLQGLADGGGGVAYICHLGGSAFGIAVAAVLVFTGLVQSERGEQNLLEIFGWVPSAAERRKRRRRRKRRLREPKPAEVKSPSTNSQQVPSPRVGEGQGGGYVPTSVSPPRHPSPIQGEGAPARLLACPNCQRKLRVPVSLAGKKIRCPGCGGVTRV